MKKIITFSFMAAIAMFALSSCKKEENKVVFEGGTPPSLTASKTATIPLSFINKDLEALKFSWTNPNYSFNTGASSQTVLYTLEMDTTGANFTNPAKKSIPVTGGVLEISLTQGEINDYLLNQLNLSVSVPHNIEFRIKSSLLPDAVVLFSNTVKFSVVPFVIPPKVTPPASGELYITGSASPSDWTNTPPPPQKFVKISPTNYKIADIVLSANNSYLFLPDFGSWNAKFGFDGGNNANNVNGDDFRANGGDMKAPAVTGHYKLEVDFKKGKFTVTPL